MTYSPCLNLQFKCDWGGLLGGWSSEQLLLYSMYRFFKQSVCMDPSVWSTRKKLETDFMSSKSISPSYCTFSLLVNELEIDYMLKFHLITCRSILRFFTSAIILLSQADWLHGFVPFKLTTFERFYNYFCVFLNWKEMLKIDAYFTVFFKWCIWIRNIFMYLLMSLKLQ